MRYGPPLQYAFVADRCILYVTFFAVVFAERGGAFLCLWGRCPAGGGGIVLYVAFFGSFTGKNILFYLLFFQIVWIFASYFFRYLRSNALFYLFPFSYCMARCMAAMTTWFAWSIFLFPNGFK